MVPELEEPRCHIRGRRTILSLVRKSTRTDVIVRLDCFLSNAHRPLDLLDPFKGNTNTSYILHSVSSANIQGFKVPTRRLHSNSSMCLSAMSVFFKLELSPRFTLEGKRICFLCSEARVIVLTARIHTRRKGEYEGRLSDTNLSKLDVTRRFQASISLQIIISSFTQPVSMESGFWLQYARAYFLVVYGPLLFSRSGVLCRGERKRR